MKYIKLDGDLIVESGSVSDGLEPSGSITVAELPLPNHGKKTYFRGGSYVYSSDPLFTPPRTIDAKRAAEYPPIADQLDAIWHAMDQGLLPKIEPMYSSVLAVKQKLPKPA